MDLESTDSLKLIEYNLSTGIRYALLEISKRYSKKKNKIFVICIAGGSASGKTEIVLKKIAEKLDDVLVLNMDNYYKGYPFIKGCENFEQKVPPAIPFMDVLLADNYDQPEALDLELFSYHLNKIKNGEVVYSPLYQMNGSYRTDKTVKIDPVGKRYIIVEGLFALNKKIIDSIFPDYKIYVGSSDRYDDVHGRIIRRLIRDPIRRGYKCNNIFKYWIDVVEPMHRKYIEPTKKYADIIINNAYIAIKESKKKKILDVQTRALITETQRDIVIKRLENMNFLLKKEFEQIDEYFVFNSSSRECKNYRSVIKIRKENGNYEVSCKGPVEKNKYGFDIRSKIEFELTDDCKDDFSIKSIKGSLIKFGYDCKKIIIKKRSLYIFNGIEVSVDRIEDVGIFLELKVNSKKHIKKIIFFVEEFSDFFKNKFSDFYMEI